MAPSEEVRAVYALGECEIDVARRELRVHGSLVPVGGRAFEIMGVLAQSAGKLVTKNELMGRIWPGAVVMNNTLQVHAAAVRKALGPYRNLLKTESGRGYRLVGDWAVRRPDAARPPTGLQQMQVSGRSPVTNFPATVTRLIGRAAAAQRLRDFVSAYRIVTLTGPGGIGKSTLALKAARRVLGEFADGGWLVELASLSDQRLVPSAVASVLDLKISEDTISAESVARAVGGQHLLLVLDNCEHVIDAVANLTETLVRLCPGATIVATSREVLRIAGENVYRVPPLEVPAADVEEPDHILGHSAVELFIARTRALESDFITRTEDLPTIAAICRRLDGIPLAIELAAAGAATLGLQQVALGLRDRFMRLTLGRRTALARQRTLRATLDWSYQLLSEAEQELLHRLAIFAGPFSLDAAYAVAAEATSYAEITHGVTGLVDKSLVFRTTNPAAAEFRLLETVRAYAMDRLAESGALAEAARRHAAYFLKALGTIDDERRSQPADAYLAAFRRRADEVHVALEWAFSATGDSAIGLALTLAGVPLWFALSQMATARGRVEQALPHAEAGSDVEMRLRIASGQTLWYSTPESDALEAAFARALEIAERIGATKAQIQALWGLWAARRSHGDYPAALEIAGLYAEAAANAGDAGAIHLGDRILGLTHHFMGHQVIAREFAERSLRQPHLLDLASGIGFQVETPAAMGSLLARILWLTGFPEQARAAANEAVAAAAKSGHSFSLCYAVSLAGLPVALWMGDMGEARRLLDLLIAHAGGIQRMEHRLPAFARLLKLRGGDEGEVLVASFIESQRDPALIPPFADVDVNAHIAVPLPRAEPVDMAWNTPELLRVDAELLLWHDAPGAVTAAELQLLRALETAREQSALSWELRAAMSLAQLWRRLGPGAEALRLLAATYGKFTEGFDTSDLVRARSLMGDLESDSLSARGHDTV
jgi:predicted ATPase/DNA-binding winged helix-turn-helix (wHTH) protein